MSTEPESFDYIVIGGGSAGCVIAARLAEDPSVRVLLLERGYDVTERVGIKPTDFTTILPPERVDAVPLEVLLTFEPRTTTRIGRALTPRALGGGPAISGAFWGRGDPSNYDEWAALGNDGWRYADLLPYFQRSESVRRIFNPGVAVSPDRGADGPLRVTSLDHADPAIQRLWDGACAAFGLERVLDHSTAAGQVGLGPMFRSLGHDPAHAERSTTYTAYVRPALAKRDNLRVESEATVTRVALSDDGRRAEGVHWVRRGESRHASAAREVIVSAGALNSARLLLLSGIGPAEELAEVGVTPRVDLPGVGRNLQDHFTLPFAYFLDGEAAGTITDPPASVPATALVGFLRSPGSEHVDLEISWTLLAPGSVLVGSIFNVRNEARGSLRLDSADPLAPPRLTFGLDPGGADVLKLIHLHQKVRRWLLGGKLALMEILPGTFTVPDDADDDAWQHWMAGRLESIHHAAGTCRMGLRSDPTSVVDARLRVHGVANLRVADCSIMPRVVSTHPSATAVMIGEKAAAMIREDHAR